eukprot:CAMPEP_0119014204 /NCGR_PEP_ID=MMETSP1176-20130426/9413_1 /TAXON_ID=265551 /ORGANISM="Synedropsis recta cf, Strain CCMP1620" /LENGTH=175 /DNA_ID=CAMNT_0006967355 /DNA_START=86 /DNA_END=613 /DNA_ORIENTATION=-
MFRLASSFLLLIGAADGFVSQPSFVCKTTSSMQLASFAEKYFQLEEREDKDVSCTDVKLNADGTVSMLQTNGPLPVESRGTWTVNDKEFKMEVTRKFESGDEGFTESNLVNRIGEFFYEVPITFVGELTTVGAKEAATGTMISSADGARGDIQVGYFSLLDTTDDLTGSTDDVAN